ncbi:PIN domain-containing protein [Streptomyces sp. NPDC060028]|uniref:PIN domain-containing protein n=1 Tax=Streptomyces sp. NPDC060028 TaxID=3347041 RepID=UPI0036CF77BF
MTGSVETVVLDAQCLSAWIAQDRKVMSRSALYHSLGASLVVCANTIVEVSHSRLSTAKLDWALSRVRIEPVTEQTARSAARLFKTAGLHGHKHAIDATVAEMALRQPGPVVMLTSDVEDMAVLCGDRVKLVGM